MFLRDDCALTPLMHLHADFVAPAALPLSSSIVEQPDKSKPPAHPQPTVSGPTSPTQTSPPPQQPFSYYEQAAGPHEESQPALQATSWPQRKVLSTLHSSPLVHELARCTSAETTAQALLLALTTLQSGAHRIVTGSTRICNCQVREIQLKEMQDFADQPLPSRPPGPQLTPSGASRFRPSGRSRTGRPRSESWTNTRRCNAGLAARGLDWHDVVFVHLHLADLSHFAAANDVYGRVLPRVRPLPCCQEPENFWGICRMLHEVFPACKGRRRSMLRCMDIFPWKISAA